MCVALAMSPVSPPYSHAEQPDLFYPLSWLLGVPSADLLYVGRLLGLKLFGNEFVAYLALTTRQGNADLVPMTPRGFVSPSAPRVPRPRLPH